MLFGTATSCRGTVHAVPRCTYYNYVDVYMIDGQYADIYYGILYTRCDRMTTLVKIYDLLRVHAERERGSSKINKLLHLFNFLSLYAS